MGSVEGPARGHSIALADLLIDHEAEVREELKVKGDGPAGALVSPVLEGVHVVDEFRMVDVGDSVQVLAGADLLSARRAVSASSTFSCYIARAVSAA